MSSMINIDKLYNSMNGSMGKVADGVSSKVSEMVAKVSEKVDEASNRAALDDYHPPNAAIILPMRAEIPQSSTKMV